MFPAPSLQIIKDCIDIAIDNGYDASEAQPIADFCDTSIKSVCPDCGGTGIDPESLQVECDLCFGTGNGPSFNTLLAEIGERNEAVQSKAKEKLKEKKNGKS